VSEHPSDQTIGGLGDKAAGMGDVSLSAESPKLAPDQELSAPPPDEIKPELPKADAPKVEAPKVNAPRETGKVMIMTPSRDQSWDGATIDHGPAAAGEAQASGPFGKQRLAAIAAVAVLAAIAGAIGGSFATSGPDRVAASEKSAAVTGRTQAMEATITRLESEIAALKTGADRSAKGDSSQFAKLNDRLDKVEKAHAESAAKLAKLSETADKQRVASAPAASPAAKDVTGSIPAVAVAPVPLPAPKPEIARLPTIEGWVLRDVANGGALIEGRQGIYEVYAGDPVPGLGRVDAIRKQDGRWVVVTSRGLIVAR